MFLTLVPTGLRQFISKFIIVSDIIISTHVCTFTHACICECKHTHTSFHIPVRHKAFTHQESFQASDEWSRNRLKPPWVALWPYLISIQHGALCLSDHKSGKFNGQTRLFQNASYELLCRGAFPVKIYPWPM